MYQSNGGSAKDGGKPEGAHAAPPSAASPVAGGAGTAGQSPGAAPRDEGPVEMEVEATLEAFAAALRVAEVFGPLLQLAVKNDEANFAKVRKAWTAMLAAEPDRDCATLRQLLTMEKASGIHKAGGVLADPSAAIALVWMRRTLTFTNAILDGTAADTSPNLGSVAGAAYKAHLEP